MRGTLNELGVYNYTRFALKSHKTTDTSKSNIEMSQFKSYLSIFVLGALEFTFRAFIDKVTLFVYI